MNEINIDGVIYVPKGSRDLERLDGKPYVVVRGRSSGVFAGYLSSRCGQEVTLLNCRRIWKWSGAASISQLAIDGTSKPELCKFPAPTDTHMILDAIEVIDCTSRAAGSIKAVKVWSE